MDEYNQGWDPEVKRYFKKIINSFFLFVFWLLLASTAGFFYDLAPIHGPVRWYNILFYVLLALSFAWLMYYLYKTWLRKP
jgi:predicted ABC-type exoprotein transport system permease subunit